MGSGSMKSEKICYKCRQTKPLAEFHRSHRTADGHETRCKECNKAHAKAWYRANQGRAKARRKLWYGQCRNRVQEKSRQWARSNLEKRRESVRRSSKKARRAIREEVF